MSAPETAPDAPGGAALFGPIRDLLMGCGGLYLIFLFALVGGAWDIAGREHAAFRPLMIFLLSVPHYGATLARVYEARAERQRYALFAYAATALVLGVYAGSLYSTLVASALVTIYLTWSPWHYTGQNFGIAMMLLRRRGVAVTPGLRRAIHASFTWSFAVVAVVMHGALGAAADYPDGTRVGNDVAFVPVGIPEIVTNWLVPLLIAGWLVSLAVSTGWLLRVGGIRRVGPILLLMFTQSLWFAIPFGLAHFDVYTGVRFLDLDRRDGLFTYIAGSHALQYLWVTTFFARSSPGWPGFAAYWGKAVLYGQLVWTLPIFALTVTSAAPLSYDGGLFLISAAALNVHHFILDGAIWKLRSGPVARILLRRQEDEPAGGSESEGARWPRRAVMSLGAVALVVAVGVYVEGQRYIAAIENEEPAEAARSLERLGWLGHEKGRDHLHVARLYFRLDQPEAALGEIRASLDLFEQPDAHALRGEIETKRGDFAAALAAYEAALALAPERTDLARGAGLAAFELGDWPRTLAHLRGIVRSRRLDPEARRAYAAAKRQLDAEEGG